MEKRMIRTADQRKTPARCFAGSRIVGTMVERATKAKASVPSVQQAKMSIDSQYWSLSRVGKGAGHAQIRPTTCVSAPSCCWNPPTIHCELPCRSRVM